MRGKRARRPADPLPNGHGPTPNGAPPRKQRDRQDEARAYYRQRFKDLVDDGTAPARAHVKARKDAIVKTRPWSPDAGARVDPELEAELSALLDQDGPTSGLAVTCLATIKPMPLHWLVPQRLPLGKLVLLAGDGGHGKSTLTLDMSANLTRGLPCFGLHYPAPPPADVLLVSCEDDFEDTVVPRLLSAGADLSRIWRVDGIEGDDGKPAPFSMAHFDAIEEELRRRPDVRLIVIDPAGAYVGKAGVDDHRDSELRALLGPLAELAARKRVTIILIKHFIKGATTKAVHKVGGSTGYVNTVRSAWVVVPDEKDDGRKLFLPLKFNIGPKPRGLAYRLVPLDAAAQKEIVRPFRHLSAEDRTRLAEQLFRIEWLGEVDDEADDAVSDTQRDGDGDTKVAEAAAWVEAFVARYAFPSEEVLKAGEELGYSRRTLFRARERLGGKVRASNRSRFGGKWWWGVGDPADWTCRPDDYWHTSEAGPQHPLAL